MNSAKLQRRQGLLLSIGLTETKLDATILDGEVNIEGYELIRSDRNRHGGWLAT